MGAIKPRFFSLFRREKATLAFRNGKKPGFGFLERALHDETTPYHRGFLDQHK
jgi:hypothetical protein